MKLLAFSRFFQVMNFKGTVLPFLFFLLVFGFFNISLAQTSKKSKAKAEEIVAKTDSDTKKKAANFYKSGNYFLALGFYLSLQKGLPSNTEYNLRAAQCYLNTNGDKSKAIPFLEIVVKQKDAPKVAFYLLGNAYHFANRFDEAIAAYDKFKSSLGGSKQVAKTDVERQIEMCKNGKELIIKPIDVSFENLGPLINSPYDDYNPFISADESILVYSARRPTTGLADESGVFGADIFVSQMKEGKWTKAKSIGTSINTATADEEALGLSTDGKKLLTFSNENESEVGDIYLATLKGKTWSKPVPFSKTVNSPDIESGATLSPDGNTLFFSSDNKFSGLGGIDLYKSNLLPDETWSAPINLGPAVNTPFDEDAPYMHADGHTLYFSSKGHNSMGGFDIFKTVFDDNSQSWSAPQNLGFPINTSDDNLYFSLSLQGKYAYICAYRPEGLGNLDIYKVNFKEIVKNSYSTIIRGLVIGTDSLNDISAKITYMNKDNPDDFGQYTPNPKNGKFVISSGPGKYKLIVDAPGYAPFKEEIVISEIMQPYFIEKQITLSKKSLTTTKDK